MSLTVGMLPWLPLSQRVTLCDYHFDMLSRLLPSFTPEITASLQAIAGTFADPFGRIDPAIAWPVADGASPTFQPPDVDVAHTSTRLLAVAALINNEYFSVFAQPATATNFTLIFQRFEVGNDFFSIVERRRDGQTLSGGYRFGEATFTRPLSAPSSALVRAPQDLLDAMSLSVHGDGPDSRRLRQSSAAFLYANRLDEFTTLDAEVFWAATALEQLLAVADRPRGQKVTQTFVERLTAQVTAPGVTPAAKRMVMTWARELYGRRSDVHGNPHPQQRWDAAWHALLATHAYGLVVRNQLAEQRVYELTDSDHAALAAFPDLVARFRASRLTSGAAVWQSVCERSRARRTQEQIRKYLEDLGPRAAD